MPIVKDPSAMTDQEFMEAVYEKHKGIMFKNALEILSDDSEKDVCVHEAIIRLMKNVSTIRALSDGALAVYVGTTVRSVALNMERRRRVEQRRFVEESLEEYDETDSGQDFEEDFLEDDARDRRLRLMRECMAELEDRDRELLVRKYIMDESDEDLARALGVKTVSVRMKLTRARRRLRKLIEGKEGKDD